ncbi:MAG TPA: UDP-2,3-diacylglucosamine diphosphatase [Terriglobales bacterium]|jgi:UDP-2,3-diacylglucosamine pyrophosphatase LpxH|nr:UDP-2,3-diacylglucosamine diphosphatase [Terriglobales bacterium]
MSSAVHDTLILSDLHLGSEISRAEQATRMLRENRFRRLILLGDIFSDLNFGRLTKPHWKFLGYIRKLSNPKRGIEVVWVEGNHDRGLSNIMSHLVGVKVYEEYEWEFEGRRHLAIHGHQFDRFAVNNLLLSTVGTLLHLQLQKLDFKGKRFSRFLDRLNARWLRLSEKVASGAILHARMRHADRVFCGHTHQAQFREREGVAYYNSGSWTDFPPTYITVDSEGVRIHQYREPSEASQDRAKDSSLSELVDNSDLVEAAEYESVG